MSHSCKIAIFQGKISEEYAPRTAKGDFKIQFYHIGPKISALAAIKREKYFRLRKMTKSIKGKWATLNLLKPTRVDFIERNEPRSSYLNVLF